MEERRGSLPGPTSVIIAGVHGNELCGVQALEQILPSLTIHRGRVLCAIGNPQACVRHLRFLDVNLNRLFRELPPLSASERASAEYTRAIFLRTILDQADAVLDLHASSVPASTPFLICEPHANSITSKLPFHTIVSGVDDAEPGGVDYYMNKRGGIGITAECGSTSDPQSVTQAINTIYAFLAARGHISNSFVTAVEQTHIHIYHLYLTKTDRFILSKPYHDFESISAGSVIGIDGDEQIRAQKESIILFAHDRQTVGSEAFLLGEIKKRLH